MGKFLDALKNIGLKVNGKKPTSTTTVGVLNEIANDYVETSTLYQHTITMTIIEDENAIFAENTEIKFLAYLPTSTPLTALTLLDVVDQLILSSKQVNANETTYMAFSAILTEDRDLYVLVKSGNNITSLYGVIADFTVEDIVQ